MYKRKKNKTQYILYNLESDISGQLLEYLISCQHEESMERERESSIYGRIDDSGPLSEKHQYI